LKLVVVDGDDEAAAVAFIERNLVEAQYSPLMMVPDEEEQNDDAWQIACAPVTDEQQ